MVFTWNMREMVARVVALLCAVHVAVAASVPNSANRNNQRVALDAPTPPTWPTSFEATYLFSLPYVKTIQSKGLKYPVRVWYDGINQKVRTDVYDGLDSTVITQDYIFSVYPRINTVACDIINETAGPTGVGNDEDAVPPPLPDISEWTYGGTAKIRGRTCNIWRLLLKAEEKIASYVFYTDAKTNVPMRLYMMGRNIIVGSHFDEYLIDILSFKPLVTDSADPFLPPKHCKGLAAPSSPPSSSSPSTRRATLALQALALLPSSHVPRRPAQLHAPNAATPSAGPSSSTRTVGQWAAYLANHNFVRSWNAANPTKGYKLALNKFAFTTPAHYGLLRGRRSAAVLGAAALQADAAARVYQRVLKDEELPKEVDWRGTGADGEVKDQATCGSCWAFAAVGTMQAAWFKATGQQLSLSEQQLVDCSWNHGGNSGCNGGLYGPAIHYVIKAGGIAQEEDYQYLGANAFCKFDSVAAHAPKNKKHKPAPPAATFTDYVKVPSRDEKALMEAVHLHGPIAVSLDASQETFKFYSEGVYSEPTCMTKEDDLDHAVTLVGYGTSAAGEDYWLIRNSWSKLWGEDGYIKVSRKYDCGITTAAGFAVAEAAK